MVLQHDSNNVVLDTNMLMAIGQFRVDVFAEIKRLVHGGKLFVPVQVKEELEVLGKRGRRNWRNVRIARIAMENAGVREKKVEAENTDSALAKLAGKGFIVATNDSALKREIKKANGRVIFLRQKKYLAFA